MSKISLVFSRNISNRLRQYDVLLSNAQDSEIMTMLATRGLTAEYLANRQAEHAEVNGLVQKMETDKLLSKSTSNQLKADRRAVEKAFRATIKDIKLLGRNQPRDLERMGLDQPLPNYQADLLDFAERFYARALPETDLIAQLSPMGITQASLEAEQAALMVVRKLEKKVISLDGEAQQAKLDRDQQLTILDDRMKEVRAMAQRALATKPQYLEKLGYTVK